MKHTILIISLILSCCSLIADELQTAKTDGARVAVLGYHDFSETRPVTNMLMRTSKFRKQMQAIKDLKLNVISLEDFQLWKEGKKEIPDRSILITIDDGWKSVYTDAFPILKEFGFPFVVYLYTDYIDAGERSMTAEMIKEMMQHGCSIGSHSVTHPLPSVIRKQKSQGQIAYEEFLNAEFGKSKEELQAMFNNAVETYAYPGGYFEPEMFPIIDQHGYQLLFTCVPGKTKKHTPAKEIPRYIIFGKDNDDYIFQNATTFKAFAQSRSSAGAIFETPEHPVSPASGEKVKTRLPLIQADLSQIENLNPNSLEMRIPGLGKVPAVYNPDSKTFQWKVNRPLRFPTCLVKVSWRLEGENNYQPALTWTFVVDREFSYLPKAN